MGRQGENATSGAHSERPEHVSDARSIAPRGTRRLTIPPRTWVPADLLIAALEAGRGAALDLDRPYRRGEHAEEAEALLWRYDASVGAPAGDLAWSVE